MNTETNVGPNLRRKLLAVMQAIGGVPKNGTAPQSQGGYAFQQAADIFPKVQRALIEVGVMFLAHEVSRRPSSSHQTKNGGVMFVDDVTMRYSFLDTDSDERLEGEGSGVAFNNSDKALNAAKTAALKYFFKQTFLIGEKGDDPEFHDTGEFDEDAPAYSFQATTDKRVTEAQALSVITWCRSEGVEFQPTFGDIFGVQVPAQLTEIQFLRWVEKRHDIVESKKPKLSKDFDKALEMVDESMDRVRQQTNQDGISQGKQKRFWAICKGNREIHDQVLDQFGYKDSRDIPWKGNIYDKICEAAAKATEEVPF